MSSPLVRSGAAAVFVVLLAALLGGCPVLTRGSSERGSHEPPAAEAGDGE